MSVAGGPRPGSPPGPSRSWRWRTTRSDRCAVAGGSVRSRVISLGITSRSWSASTSGSATSFSGAGSWRHLRHRARHLGRLRLVVAVRLPARQAMKLATMGQGIASRMGRPGIEIAGPRRPVGRRRPGRARQGRRSATEPQLTADADRRALASVPLDQLDGLSGDPGQHRPRLLRRSPRRRPGRAGELRPTSTEPGQTTVAGRPVADPRGTPADCCKAGARRPDAGRSVPTQKGVHAMPIATPEVYAEMLDTAKAGRLRLPGHQRHVVADHQRRPAGLHRGRHRRHHPGLHRRRRVRLRPDGQGHGHRRGRPRRVRARGRQELPDHRRAAHRPLPEGQARRLRPAAASRSPTERVKAGGTAAVPVAHVGRLRGAARREPRRSPRSCCR